jgi:P4 family phage/plasmid primase-like protien
MMAKTTDIVLQLSDGTVYTATTDVPATGKMSSAIVTFTNSSPAVPYDKIPEELKARKQWQTFCFTNGEKDFSGKYSNKPQTWLSFEQVQDKPHIMYAISDQDPYMGIDLDDCLENGVLTEPAQKIVDMFADFGYIEISPSGSGIKILCRGKKPEGMGCRDQVNSQQIEIYDQGRWWCMTGNPLPSVLCPQILVDAQERVNELASLLNVKPKQLKAEEKGSPTPQRPASTPATGRALEYLRNRAIAYLNKIQQPAEGTRNDIVYGAAGELLVLADNDHSTLPIDVVTQLLHDRFGSDPEITYTFIEKRVRSAAKNNPRPLKLPLKNELPDCSWLTGKNHSNEIQDEQVTTPEFFEDCDDTEEFFGDTNKKTPDSLYVESEAKSLLKKFTQDGVSKLRYWLDRFWLWNDGRYEEISKNEVRAVIAQHLNENFSKIGTSEVSDTLEQVKCQSILRSRTEPPCWLAGDSGWNPNEVIATKNALIHLPSLADGCKGYLVQSTPKYFTQTAVDYEFSTERSNCPRWLGFLHSLWGEDSESIELLQDWFGYCLTPDTQHHKILMMLGPPRSGKGTIVRVLRGVIGESNCAGPTFSSIATNFGLSPLLGKSLAVISDARLSRRTDQAVVTERLLSISGEDALDIDKKYVDPCTTKLRTRLMIVSNEIPQLAEASGALAGRMLLLRLTKSFLGKEDRGLTGQLMAERDGILWWAIDGWLRLRQRGFFVEPTSSELMRAQLHDIASPIGSFVSDFCELGSDYRVDCKELFEAYKDWCLQLGIEPSNIQVFGRDLIAHCPNVSPKQYRVGGFPVRGYAGIKVVKNIKQTLDPLG